MSCQLSQKLLYIWEYCDQLLVDFDRVNLVSQSLTDGINSHGFVLYVSIRSPFPLDYALRTYSGVTHYYSEAPGYIIYILT